MKVKAVVVNYNTGPRLLQCVQALRGESQLDAIWVVDNASMDGSLDAIVALQAEEPRLQVVRNPKNIGFGAANNVALCRDSEADWLLVNPDCMVSPGVVNAFWQCRSVQPDAGLLGGLVLNPDGTEQRGCRRDLPGIRTAALRTLGIFHILGLRRWNNFDLDGSPVPTVPTPVGAISGALMYFNAAALKTIGNFDEGYFLHCEDLDICKRMALGGWRVLFVPDARAVHYRGTSSRRAPLRVIWHKHRSMWRYFDKFLRRTSPAWLVMMVWIGIWSRFLLLLPETWLASIAARRRFPSHAR